jgi:hypothetical protein
MQAAGLVAAPRPPPDRHAAGLFECVAAQVVVRAQVVEVVRRVGLQQAEAETQNARVKDSAAEKRGVVDQLAEQDCGRGAVGDAAADIRGYSYSRLMRGLRSSTRRILPSKS